MAEIIEKNDITEEELQNSLAEMAKVLEPLRQSEAAAVRRLGDHIGYGRMMQLATQLWGDHLESIGLPRSGAFVSALQHDLDELSSLRAEVETLRTLVALAQCPCCDGSGGYPEPDGHGDWKQAQCQWCFEKQAALRAEQEEDKQNGR